MELSFASLSNSAGIIAYALLAIFLIRRGPRRDADRALITASILSIAWLGALTLQSISVAVSFDVRYTLEVIRTASWFGVLYALLGIGFFPSPKLGLNKFFITVLVLLLLAALLGATLFKVTTGQVLLIGGTLLVIKVTLSIVGLLLIEQVWRNTSVYSRTSIKFLVIGMATLFGYDFFMYSDALLFKELSPAYWDARGAINALVAPLIAYTLYISNTQPIAMQISRQMVFHTTTLVIAGVYLLFLSAGGYYINAFGGTWGSALRVLFVSIGVLALVILISSPPLRARIMVFISKNFFDYQYDYREEWINSTNTLRQSFESHSLPLQAVRVLAQLIGCQQGAIWCRNDENNFEVQATMGLPEHHFGLVDSNADLVAFFNRNNWIINIHELMLDPTKYELIEIPKGMLDTDEPWLIIPLAMRDKLTAFVLLCNPVTTIELNWENYDLLKIVAQQASSYLEQTDSQEKLAEARQFEAVSKTSAFLVHDIKTIIAQLSLLVRNAEKHKSNPDFIDDMIRTTQHTVEKMDHLLHQIRNPNLEERHRNIELSALLVEIYNMHKNAEPLPSIELPPDDVWINTDPEQLRSVIGHIIQNAIDATPKDGAVTITTKTAPECVYIFIQDNGCGMSEEFIKHQLFKPFESTKGLTGMGIGAYQSREYLRKVGGTINVTSQPDIGTCFTLKIPTINQTAK
jgi:putative PEP-CTERM system histidine kinase